MTSHAIPMFRSTATRILAQAATGRFAASATRNYARILHTPSTFASSSPRGRRIARRTFSATTRTGRKCPACGSPLPTPLPACSNCDYIAPLSQSSTYYEILGLPEDANKFDVDPKVLKDCFRQLQRVIHPDKWSNKGPVGHSFACVSI